MRLCFGTFATVLYHCRRGSITQAALVGTLARIVDPESRYIGVDRYKDKTQITGDRPAATKLINCKIDFVLSYCEDIQSVTLDGVVQSIKVEIAPLVDEDKKAAVILTLLRIIQDDESIDIDKQNSFAKYFGIEKSLLLQQEEFEFSEFLARTLFYTVHGGIDNKVGGTCVKSITRDYIDNIFGNLKYEVQWDSSSQIITLLFRRMFRIFDMAIKTFWIENLIQTDPTVFLNINLIYKCEDFLMHLRKDIGERFCSCENGTIFCKIREFAQLLDEYSVYLGRNMRSELYSTSDSTNSRVDVFVPLYRDENAKQAMVFNNKTRDYRQQITSIYSEIWCYNTMLGQHPPQSE